MSGVLHILQDDVFRLRQEVLSGRAEWEDLVRGARGMGATFNLAVWLAQLDEAQGRIDGKFQELQRGLLKLTLAGQAPSSQVVLEDEDEVLMVYGSTHVGRDLSIKGVLEARSGWNGDSLTWEADKRSCTVSIDRGIPLAITGDLVSTGNLVSQRMSCLDLKCSGRVHVNTDILGGKESRVKAGHTLFTNELLRCVALNGLTSDVSVGEGVVSVLGPFRSLGPLQFQQMVQQNHERLVVSGNIAQVNIVTVNGWGGLRVNRGPTLGNYALAVQRNAPGGERLFFETPDERRQVVHVSGAGMAENGGVCFWDSGTNLNVSSRVRVDSSSLYVDGDTITRSYLHVNGGVEVTEAPGIKVKQGETYVDVLPRGMIIMWSGSHVPEGWAFCDGEDGRPDLREHFVKGATPDEPVGHRGGTRAAALEEKHLPSHTHVCHVLAREAHTHSLGQAGDTNGKTSVTGSHAHSGETSEALGEIVAGLDDPRVRVSDLGVQQTLEALDKGFTFPEHSHTVHPAGEHFHFLDVAHGHTVTEEGSHSHSLSMALEGEGKPFDMYPPYYTMAYIFKL